MTDTAPPETIVFFDPALFSASCPNNIDLSDIIYFRLIAFFPFSIV